MSISPGWEQKKKRAFDSFIAQVGGSLPLALSFSLLFTFYLCVRVCVFFFCGAFLCFCCRDSWWRHFVALH